MANTYTLTYTMHAFGAIVQNFVFYLHCVKKKKKMSRPKV